VNVFTDEATQAAIDFMAIPDRKTVVGSAEVFYRTAVGRLDDYLNVQMRLDPLRVPTYRLDDSGLWMTLTPMEVQSAWVPIQRAHGTVVLGGLGLGYAALAMAAKPEVTRVTVDVYQSMLPDEIIKHIKVFTAHNDFGEYRFWGQELCSYLHGAARDWTEHRLFKQHSDTGNESLRPPVVDYEFAEYVVMTLEEVQ